MSVIRALRRGRYYKDHSQLHTKFEAILDYMKFCLKANKITNKAETNINILHYCLRKKKSFCQNPLVESLDNSPLDDV